MQYDFDWYLREGRRLVSEGLPTEDTLRFFRANGATIIESIKLLRQLKNIDLGEAKKIVHFSETWQDCRASNEQLHEDAEKAALELSREDPEGDT